MDKRTGRIALWLFAFAAAWLVWRGLRTQPPPASERASPHETSGPRWRVDRPQSRALPRSAPRASGQPRGCLPDAALRCHQGDVWTFDSCGRPQEKLEECENRACLGDACDEPANEPCEDPAEGRCDGDSVRLCQAGRALRVDCRARGLRCAYGDEGAECVPDVPAAQRCSSARSRCDGELLTSCLQERLVRTDCRTLGARCLQLPGAPAPRCVEVKPFAAPQSSCGPCGCPPSPGGTELACDGHDDDGDGLIDEGLDCGPVPVIAFIATDNAGQSSHGPDDVDAELAVAARLFAREPPETGLSFAREDVIFLADPSLLELDDRDISRLASDPRLHPPRDKFYIPLLFTDRILSGGGVPKLGVSTLPNGSCGGLQLGHGPDVGLVAVAKARSPTTVVHELGHFLGLCHTHGTERGTGPVALLAASDPSSGALVVCGAGCRAEGDGLCDTPVDPGPPHCAYDLTCRAACASGAAPDATNLMSYYTECRNHFSDEQAALMQHTLALRRAWQPCFAAGCACAFGANDCPAGMSCQPFALPTSERTARCALDGLRPPGADCKDPGDCGRGSICLTDARRGIQRCVRPCSTSYENCECVAAGEELSVCLQDLGS